MSEQFIEILERSKNKEIIPFLQLLNDAQKKGLAPEIKKLSKEYFEYKPEGTGSNISYKQKANEAQREILLLSTFVCLNKADYEKTTYPGWILDEKYLGKLIDWYCPSWFSDFVNSQLEKGGFFHSFKYNHLMELVNKGLLQPSKKVVLSLLPLIIFEQKESIAYYRLESVLKHPLTLQEHIWYFFEEESNIHYSDRWIHIADDGSKEDKSWMSLFKKYAAEGKIERSRLLRESLLASNRNFNKVLSGWFCELFTILEPTATEIGLLQNELFSVLNANHSKPVSTALQAIKKILDEESFDRMSFLDHCPMLLTNDTKGVVTATLTILEKLAKKNPPLQLQICDITTAAFIHADDDIHARAAKIIAAYKDKLAPAFSEQLQQYTLMSSARKLLESFYSVKQNKADVNNENHAIADPVAEILSGEIPYPQTIDDLIFLCSQAFDNNQSWYVDILPAAIIKWQDQLQGENINKLEPALQRAIKITKGAFNSTQGSLDHMLAVFFIDVCIYLSRTYPSQAKKLTALFNSFDTVDANGVTTTSFLAIEKGQFYMEKWKTGGEDPFYSVYHHLLITALQKITENDSLPLLSTPTHLPAWIHPETLVKRWKLYQKEGKPVFNIDVQIACSRCLLQGTDNAISMTEQNMYGEAKNMLLFLFGKHKEPVGPFENMAAWVCCSLALKEKKKYKAFEGSSYYKNPFSCYDGNHPWKSITEEYDHQTYDFQLQKMVTQKATRKKLIVQISKPVSNEVSGIKKLFSGFLHKPKPDPLLIYDLLEVKSQWGGYERDVRRIILLTPNNTAPFLAHIIKTCLQFGSFFSEGGKKTVIASLEVMHELWDDESEMAYLLLATSMIAGDKTASNIAGEIWLKAVKLNKMDNKKLGQIIAIHMSIELAPFKRLTDLVSQVLYNISDTYNSNLRIFIETVLSGLPDMPVKNLKKMLELYHELTSSEKNFTPPAELQAKLSKWTDSGSLQKIIKTINTGT